MRLLRAGSARGREGRPRRHLALPNCPQFLIAESAAWKVGAIACPFNPTYTRARDRGRAPGDGRRDGGRAQSILRKAEDRSAANIGQANHRHRTSRSTCRGTSASRYTLFKEKKDGERIDARGRRFSFRATLLSKVRDARRRRSRDEAPDDPAVILMSGGTTGTPKGVTGTHRGMVIAGLQLQAWLSPAMNEWTDKIMLPLPLFHTLRGTPECRASRSSITIRSRSFRIRATCRDLLHEINRVKPAFICTVPTLLNGIMNHPMARAGKVDFTLDQAVLLGPRH